MHIKISPLTMLFCVLVSPRAETVTNSIGMTLVMVRPAEFRMGSPADEPMRQQEEKLHTVRITRAFAISTTEVTQKQWADLMGNNPSANRGDSLPVDSVSWTQAVEFCRKLSEREGRTYRLPMEAEWELACRAEGSEATDTSPIIEAAWYADNAEGASHPVAAKSPNGWGLYDMLGNVSEWCLDYYAPYDQASVEDPRGPLTGRARVLRGGSWKNFKPALRPAARSSAPEAYQLAYVGFRVGLELDHPR